MLNFDFVFEEVRQDLRKRYGVDFELDYKRFAKKLKDKYGQDLDNIQLNKTVIINIALEPISIKDYAAINNRSYSSIFGNKDYYKTLNEIKKTKNTAYTIAEMELCHSYRMGSFIEMIATLINNDDELLLELNKSESLRSDVFKAYNKIRGMYGLK